MCRCFRRAEHTGSKRNAKAVAAAADELRAEFGRIDVLIANAGIGGNDEATRSYVPRSVRKVIEVNLLGAVNAVHAVVPQMVERGEGQVVAISSLAGFRGLPKSAAYSASKGGLMTLSKNLANTLGQWRVRVHVLNVGWTLTEGEQIVQRDTGAGPDWLGRAAATRPWKRLLEADEIAAAAAFLASDEAAVFSGAAIDLEQFPVGRPCE